MPTVMVFIGCYTKGAGGEGEGVVCALRDPARGTLSAARTAAVTASPSYLARHPVHPVLYASHELDDGAVSAFEVAGDGTLRPLGRWASGGQAPCHLTVDEPGQHLFVANYAGGTLAVFALDAAGVPSRCIDVVVHRGHSKHPQRQQGPHVHSVAAVDGGVLAVDLGLDAVYHYPHDLVTGRLGAAEVAMRLPPGTGPRHLTRDSAGRVYLVGELDASVTAFTPGRHGWQELARVPSSADPGALPSEIAVSADGAWLYVANRGPDTIAVFALCSGVPQLVGEVGCGGIWPRHLLLLDGYLYVANQRSHQVTTLRIDAATALPEPTGHRLDTPSPSCVLDWRA